jgi:hypothetical protein
MAQLFLILFLVGLFLTQIVDYVGIYYLDTVGFIVMGVAAISYFITLIVKAIRKRSAAGGR